MNEVEKKFNILYSKIKISDSQTLSDFYNLKFEHWGFDLVFGEEKITPENYYKIESEYNMFSVTYISRDKKYYRCRYISSTIAAVTLYIQFARFHTKKVCINKAFENKIKNTLSNGNIKEAENIIIDEIGEGLICFEKKIPNRVSIFVNGYKESEPFIFLNSVPIWSLIPPDPNIQDIFIYSYRLGIDVKNYCLLMEEIKKIFPEIAEEDEVSFMYLYLTGSSYENNFYALGKSKISKFNSPS